MARHDRRRPNTFTGAPHTMTMGRRGQTFFGAWERARQDQRLRDAERACLGEGRWRDPVTWYHLWATVTLLALGTLILVGPLGAAIANAFPTYQRLAGEHAGWVDAFATCARIVVVLWFAVVVIITLPALALLPLQHIARSQRSGLYHVTLFPQAEANAVSHADLLVGLHAALPSAAWRALIGREAALALHLTGRPNLPVQMGLYVPAHEKYPGLLRKSIEGQWSGARVVEEADPLHAAMRPGRIVMWRDWTLRGKATLPLRMSSRPEHTDLMATLLGVLRPRPGVDVVDLQLILRPVREPRVRGWGWRRQGLRHLARLTARVEPVLRMDAAQLEEKLAGVGYDTLLRVVVIAEHAENARRELDEVSGALGQYTQRLGRQRQGFRPIRIGGAGRLRVPASCSAAVKTIGSVAILSLTVLGGWAGVELGLLARPYAAVALADTPLPEGVAKYLPGMVSGLGAILIWSLLRWFCGFRTRAQVAKLRARAHRLWLPRSLIGLPFVALPGQRRTILTPPEIAGLWHPPSLGAGPLIRWLPNRQIDPPAIAFCGDDPRRIPLALGRRADGSEAMVGPPLRDLRQILHATAGVGTGKSRTLVNMAHGAIQRGHGLTSLDGKGDTNPFIQRLIPLDRERDLVLLDASDVTWPFGFNPFEPRRTNDGLVDRITAQLMAGFAKLNAGSWDRMPGVQEFAVMSIRLLLAAEPQPNLVRLKQALIDDNYRARLLRRSQDEEVNDFWTMIFPQMQGTQKGSRDAFLRRLKDLVASDILRTITAQPCTTFDLRAAMDQQGIVLVTLNDRDLPGPLMRTLGTLLFAEIVGAAFSRRDIADERQRSDHLLLLDEAHNFIAASTSEDVERALSQLRGYGVCGVYMHQSLDQLGDLQSTMLVNAQNRILLRTLDPDSAVYARRYAAQSITAADISGQDPQTHQYMEFLVDGQSTRLFSVRPLPWPVPQQPEVPRYHGPDWRTVRAKAKGHRELVLDESVIALSQLAERDVVEAANRLAVAGIEAIAHIRDRLAEHNAARRRHILAHPGCIPDQLERQCWLSRLKVGVPLWLALAEYRRIRDDFTPVAQRSQHATQPKGEGGQAHSTRSEQASSGQPSRAEAVPAYSTVPDM